VPHPRHDEVRAAHDGTCGYCGTHEAETGGELTVDHYKPTCAGGTDEQENLVYACYRCNLYKGDYWSDEPDSRVLLPSDDHKLHLVEDPSTGLVTPSSKRGRIHIALLRLNRPELVARRLRRRVIQLRQTEVQLLRRENRELKVLIERLRAALRNRDWADDD